MNIFKRLGVNYLWGLLNFTAGCILCSIYVVFLLASTGHIR